MKSKRRLLVMLPMTSGCLALLFLSVQNHQLSIEHRRLEAELGYMPIRDTDRVHIVEIESPEVPPEVASQVERVWQFRCYYPPGYDFVDVCGDGRITKDGLYQDGSYGTHRRSQQANEIHQLLTVSLQRKDNLATVSFGGGSQTLTWNHVPSDRIDSLVVRKLVSSDQGSRSFDQKTILPLLKIYDPNSAEEKQIAGTLQTTYLGGTIVICPKSLEYEFEKLRKGDTPSNYDPAWIATELSDE